VTYATLACAVDGLTRRGFTEDFRAVDGRLRALRAGQTFAAEDLEIREFHRFEGISDPDDMAVVYAIESKSGIRGTFADAFGASTHDAEGVPTRRNELIVDGALRVDGSTCPRTWRGDDTSLKVFIRGSPGFGSAVAIIGTAR
jgi:hypothetical protein